MQETNFVLCGMAFGDEGKGSFVDFLAHEHGIKLNIKYNGGSHAGHSVALPDGRYHKFSQLGSGMFAPDSTTVLTPNTVVNPINVCAEVEEFAQKTGASTESIYRRILIDPECYCVTRYHKLTNKMRELARGKNRLSSFGTGVSEVMKVLRETGIGLKFGDLYKSDCLINTLHTLREYTVAFYEKNYEAIYENVPDNVVKYITEEIDFLEQKEALVAMCEDYRAMVLHCPWQIGSLQQFFSYSPAKLKEPAIYEGSQGLLLDFKVGLRPNTTQLDTTANYAVQMLKSAGQHFIKVGIFKAFASRHGFGVFPTQDSAVNIADENQDSLFWNGSIKFGWFDAVLARYAQKYNQVDQLLLSSLDLLSTFPKIRVCNQYVYHGERDRHFERMFDYSIEEERVIINDIKCADELLAKYLEQCKPRYIDVEGWMSDVSDAKTSEQLPAKCLEYIGLLAKLVGVPIFVVSVGATRENKVRMV